LQPEVQRRGLEDRERKFVGLSALGGPARGGSVDLKHWKLRIKSTGQLRDRQEVCVGENERNDLITSEKRWEGGTCGVARKKMQRVQDGYIWSEGIKENCTRGPEDETKGRKFRGRNWFLNIVMPNARGDEKPEDRAVAP